LTQRKEQRWPSMSVMVPAPSPPPNSINTGTTNTSSGSSGSGSIPTSSSGSLALSPLSLVVTITPPGSTANNGISPHGGGGASTTTNSITQTSSSNNLSGNSTPTSPPLSPSLEILTAALVANAPTLMGPASPRQTSPPPGIAIVGRSADPTNIEDLTVCQTSSLLSSLALELIGLLLNVNRTISILMMRNLWVI
jgi:hypothetical protein